jgi:CubicO group peptidase (beta-lactamase class C family)
MTENEPGALGWMEGFPPAADKVVRFADGSYYSWPQLRWSFSHMEQLVPTKIVWRGAGVSRRLPENKRQFDHLVIETTAGSAITWTDMLSNTYTDGLAIMHRGELVYEEYFGACGPHDLHTLMSCNKSMVGTIAECLIHQGTLDESALVPNIVPELAESAWSDATVRQVLDMVIGMKFHEDYLDPDSDVWKFLRSSGMIPSGPDSPASVADYLPTVMKEGEHGEAFAYREPNIFVLGWIVRRAAGLSLAALASEMVWQHVGAEHDWLYMVDNTGAETTAVATLRDFVRFGEMICGGGRLGDNQIVPTAVIDSIMAGGDQEVFAKAGYETLPDWSYKSQWWIRHIDGRVCPTARGAHGQMLYVDPTLDVVIARFGSAPDAPSYLLDHILLPTIDAICRELAN